MVKLVAAVSECGNFLLLELIIMPVSDVSENTEIMVDRAELLFPIILKETDYIADVAQLGDSLCP